MLRKGVHPYKYVDDWDKFNEITLSGKEEFCSNLYMEDIQMQITFMENVFVGILKQNI